MHCEDDVFSLSFISQPKAFSSSSALSRCQINYIFLFGDAFSVPLVACSALWGLDCNGQSEETEKEKEREKEIDRERERERERSCMVVAGTIYEGGR
jgi:hypothetical protein